MNYYKLILQILNIIEAITIFTVGIGIVEFIIDCNKINIYYSYLLYFGGGVALYRPINFVLKDGLNDNKR